MWPLNVQEPDRELHDDDARVCDQRGSVRRDDMHAAVRVICVVIAEPVTERRGPEPPQRLTVGVSEQSTLYDTPVHGSDRPSRTREAVADVDSVRLHPQTIPLAVREWISGRLSSDVA